MVSLPGLFVGPGRMEEFGVLEAGGGVIVIHLQHLLNYLERLLREIFFLVLGGNLAVLGQGVADETLLVVQPGDVEGCCYVAGIESLDLLVDGDRLQVVAVVGVVLADILVLLDRLFLAVVAHEELGQALPIPDVVGLHGHHLLVVLDRLVDLPLEHELLCALQNFVFFGSQVNASYRLKIGNLKLKQSARYVKEDAGTQAG